MTIEVHGTALSPPCRLVYVTCEVLGIDYTTIEVDLFKGGNKTPQYLKLNPQHNVPAMVDGKLVLNESRAIATYLGSMASTYGGNAKLYPTNDIKTKAIVDQRLHFDAGTFYKAFQDCVYPLVFGYGATPGEKEQQRFDEVMGWVQDFIKPTGYVAGTNHLTVADLAFLATYSTIVAVGHFDLSAYSDVNAWFEKVKGEVPNYEKSCGQGAAIFGGLYTKAMKK